MSDTNRDCLYLGTIVGHTRASAAVGVEDVEALVVGLSLTGEGQREPLGVPADRRDGRVFCRPHLPHLLPRLHIDDVDERLVRRHCQPSTREVGRRGVTEPPARVVHLLTGGTAHSPAIKLLSCEMSTCRTELMTRSLVLRGISSLKSHMLTRPSVEPKARYLPHHPYDITHSPADRSVSSASGMPHLCLASILRVLAVEVCGTEDQSRSVTVLLSGLKFTRCNCRTTNIRSIFRH